MPEAEIEFRVGGAFNVCMRSPEGRNHWVKGKYVEIIPISRLAIDMTAIAPYYAALLPFFFLAGLFIGLSFVLNARRIGVVYGWDLAGAGAGAACVTVGQRNAPAGQ